MYGLLFALLYSVLGFAFEQRHLCPRIQPPSSRTRTLRVTHFESDKPVINQLHHGVGRAHDLADVLGIALSEWPRSTEFCNVIVGVNFTSKMTLL